MRIQKSHQSPMSIEAVIQQVAQPVSRAKGRGRNLYVKNETWAAMGRMAMSRDMSVSALIDSLVELELKRATRRKAS
jgi:predicted DNA-binding ribbon-helix-helix protein